MRNRIIPMSNKVLVKMLKKEEVAGALILPDSSKKPQEKGEVIAVGPGKRDNNGAIIPIDVKIGDVILMEKYSAQEITLDDEEFVIVSSDNIIAIVENVT